MSDRLAAQWDRVRGEGRAAFIPYLTAGYPTLDRAVDAFRMLEAAGADLIEVGVPFSDPLADGVTIQRSTQAALEQGMTVRQVFAGIERAALGVPTVIMTYLNPVLAYGVERFLVDAAAAGASGVLLTDFPAGADPALEAQVAESPLALIRLVAPTTTTDRLGQAVRGARGFIYVISRLGVTGVREAVPSDLEAQVQRVRSATTLPVAVGFGIATPMQAAQAARVADGVVVGSALVDALGQGLGAAERLAKDLARAVRQAR